MATNRMPNQDSGQERAADNPFADNAPNCPGIIPANRSSAACHKPCSRWTRIAGDHETRLARSWDRLDEQRTSECQFRAHCAASPECLSPAADFATSLIALGKGMLGRPYLLSSTLQAWLRKNAAHPILPG